MSARRWTTDASVATRWTRDDEAKDLIRRALAAGGRARQTGSGHIMLSLPGGNVTMPSSPSDHRSMKNARARIRRAGLT